MTFILRKPFRANSLDAGMNPRTVFHYPNNFSDLYPRKKTRADSDDKDKITDRSYIFRCPVYSNGTKVHALTERIPIYAALSLAGTCIIHFTFSSLIQCADWHRDIWEAAQRTEKIMLLSASHQVLAICSIVYELY